MTPAGYLTSGGLRVSLRVARDFPDSGGASSPIRWLESLHNGSKDLLPYGGYRPSVCRFVRPEASHAKAIQ